MALAIGLYGTEKANLIAGSDEAPKKESPRQSTIDVYSPFKLESIIKEMESRGGVLGLPFKPQV